VCSIGFCGLPEAAGLGGYGRKPETQDPPAAARWGGAVIAAERDPAGGLRKARPVLCVWGRGRRHLSSVAQGVHLEPLANSEL
jgi:hypothetical protein